MQIVRLLQKEELKILKMDFMMLLCLDNYILTIQIWYIESEMVLHQIKILTSKLTSVEMRKVLLISQHMKKNNRSEKRKWIDLLS